MIKQEKSTFLRQLNAFLGSWKGTIIIVLVLIFFVMQAFTIPTRSMVGTLYEGEFLFVKKFVYGIPIPRIPWAEVAILPDFFDNGHLIEGKRPQRGDIVVFIPPHEPKQYYVKRTFAVGGDEVIFDESGFYLHPFEGDEYVKEHYKDFVIVERMGKLFVKEPYRAKGIHYQPFYYNLTDARIYQEDEQGELYERVCVENAGEINAGDGSQNCHLWERRYSDKPLETFIKDSNNAYHKMKSLGSMVSMKDLGDAFYQRIDDDEFFMIGDNRNNSGDSRFWGSVPYRNIIGQPWFIYFSLNKANSEEARADIDKKQRYTIRWNRMFKTVSQLEAQADYNKQ